MEIRAGHGNKTNHHPGWKARVQAARRADATARQARRDARSVGQQLDLLDQRLGTGVGAVKERSRLARPASGTVPPAPPDPTTMPPEDAGRRAHLSAKKKGSTRRPSRVANSERNSERGEK